MTAESDEPPSPRQTAGVDINEFFFPGEGVSSLLVHGLTGTPYEMRYLGERLAARGVRVRGVKLAGHASAPENLGLSSYDNWYESVVLGLEELRQFSEPIVVVGLSMGAVLSARVAADQREAVAGPVMLLDLCAVVKPKLASITQPALVMHAKRDHTCPMRKNLDYVMKHLGSPEKRAIELDESYHVITVDSEKENVANEVIEFVERFRLAPEKRAAG